MKTFKFEVSDGFFPVTFKGEIMAKNKTEAKKQLKDEYAMELDTEPKYVKVLLLEEVK